MVSGKKYSSTQRSVKPCLFSSRTMCSMMGTLPTGTSGLGTWAVRGLRRVPNPPAITTAFTSGSPKGRMGTATGHRAYRSIAEMPERRNLRGTARTAVPGVARPQGEEQKHPGEESSQVGEPGCLPAHGLAAGGRTPPRRQAAQGLDEGPQAQGEAR